MEQVIFCCILLITPLSELFKVECIQTLLIQACHNLFQSQVPIHTVHRIVKSIPEDELLAANLHQEEGLARVGTLQKAYSLKEISVKEGERYKYFWAPCPNCKHLIAVATANLDNFLPWTNAPSDKDFKEGEGSKAKAEVKENGHLVSA